MRRARFEGSAPWLWILAALLATIFFCLDPTRLGRPSRRAPGPPEAPVDEDARFFELPPLPPPGSDAGVRAPRQR